MSDQIQDESTEEDAEAESPDRDFPISSTARFTVNGKPLVLDDFVDITTGDIANRPMIEPRPQPNPLPKQVVWNARRPLED